MTGQQAGKRTVICVLYVVFLSSYTLNSVNTLSGKELPVLKWIRGIDADFAGLLLHSNSLIVVVLSQAKTPYTRNQPAP